MMMGVGNLTELTDVDSAGVNVLLLGFCQEVGIRSVLTTQVINWCRSCVRELDLARRLVYHACTQHACCPSTWSPTWCCCAIRSCAARRRRRWPSWPPALRDRNFRLFAERGLLHVHQPIRCTCKAPTRSPCSPRWPSARPIDPAHAFYLGYEMAKAVTALTLGKNYVQDQALRWGFLTVPEESHRDTTSRDARGSRAGPRAAMDVTAIPGT